MRRCSSFGDVMRDQASNVSRRVLNGIDARYTSKCFSIHLMVSIGEAIHLASMSRILTSGLNKISQGASTCQNVNSNIAIKPGLSPCFILSTISSANPCPFTMQHFWFLSFARSVFPSHQNPSPKGRRDPKCYCSTLAMNTGLVCSRESSQEKRFSRVPTRSTRLEVQPTRLKMLV